MIAGQVAAGQIIRRNHWGDRVEALDKLAAVNAAYIAFAKRRALLERINRALAEMRIDGSYEKIVRDYIKGAPAH